MNGQRQTLQDTAASGRGQRGPQADGQSPSHSPALPSGRLSGEPAVREGTEHAAPGEAKPIAGIQLYSLRSETERDFLGTLERVASIGYKAVEAAGYYNCPPRRIKSKLDELGLQMPSAFAALNFKAIGKLESDFARQIDFAAELGVGSLVTPWIPIQEQPSMEDVQFVADVLRRCGEQVNAAGMRYGWHHHEYELKLVDGRPALDRLLELVPPELMFAELDLGWIYMAGYSPTAYLNKYAGRVPFVHLRDFEAGRKDVELGRGQVGCDALLGELAPAGVQCFYVQQEQFAVNALAGAQANFNYLQRMGYA